MINVNEASDLNLSRFQTLVAVSIRYRVSNRATAAIATATMVDLGLVREDDKSLVLDHSNGARDKKTLIEEIWKYRESDNIIFVMFDGRKNNTGVMLQCPETGTKYAAVEKSVLKEPNSQRSHQEDQIC